MQFNKRSQPFSKKFCHGAPDRLAVADFVGFVHTKNFEWFLNKEKRIVKRIRELFKHQPPSPGGRASASPNGYVSGRRQGSPGVKSALDALRNF